MGVFDGYKKLNTDVTNDIKEKLQKLIHVVKEEQHGEHRYWFDAETDQFLGQGATYDDIIDVVKKRFQGHVFIHDTEILSGPDWKMEPIVDIQTVTDRLNREIKL
jgi:hypothetical protein